MYWAAQHLSDLIDGTADEPSTGTIPMKTSAEPFTGTIPTEPSPTKEPTTHEADPVDPTGIVVSTSIISSPCYVIKRLNQKQRWLADNNLSLCVALKLISIYD